MRYDIFYDLDSYFMDALCEPLDKSIISIYTLTLWVHLIGLHINQKHINQPIGDHFNKPGHSIDNFTVSVIEKVKSSEKLYRKEREKYLIKKFNTYYNGLNKNTGG